MLPLAARRSAFTTLRRCSKRHQLAIISNRPFSKYEVEVQDASTPSTEPAVGPNTLKKPLPTLSPSQIRSVEEIAEQMIMTEHKAQLELHDAHALLSRLCAEAQAILSNSETSSSDEIVATADYVLILMNDDELDSSIARIRALQREIDEQQSDQSDSFAHDGELSRAVDAMNKLHHVFLTTIDSCIPPIYSTAQHIDHDSNDHLPVKVPFDAKTVARALQLSRRAEDLDLPLHRPLYRRLAISVVLTSLPQLDGVDADARIDGVTPLVLRGQFQQREEGIHPPIAMELIDLCIRARSALKIPSPIFSIERDPLELFAAEILGKPLLLLLKQKQWEEAMGLLRGWREHFGRSEKINLLDMLGEDTTLEALDIAKGWVVDGEFRNDTQDCRHTLELTNLLQDSLEVILNERKCRAEKLSRILPNIIFQLDSPSDDEDFDSDASDSEFEEEFDSDDDEDWEQSSALESVIAGNAEIESITLEYKALDSVDEHQIIPGMSNKDARLRIYLRNRCDWSLPDLVGQLEEWNKGEALSFTPAFERYLGQQMTNEDEEYYD
ncbi:hypothetical protein ACHAXM_008349 [Skeletonema potamos]